jgi:site-specific recombinase XerD
MVSSSLTLSEGARQEQSAVPPSWQHAFDSFAEFQLEHRGLSPETLRNYTRVLRSFAAHVSPSAGIVDPTEVTVAHVDGFLVQYARPRGGNFARQATTALRAFLRYLALDGQVDAELAAQVPSMRTYALAGLPRGIAWDDVLRVLGAMPRDNAAGRRNYAMLMVLATYGLRVGDVAALRLDDVHWRDAKIAFRMGKNGRRLALPLIDSVGDALADYIQRDRPRCEHREVFLSLLRPPHSLTTDRIAQIAQVALDRGGVKRSPGMATHTFRHSLATQLVRQGVKLETVGDCLGHGSTETTFVYTKLAVEDLRSVSLDPQEVLR